MLSENDLEREITSGRIFNNSHSNKFQIQSSSIDIPAKQIHIPKGNNKNSVKQSHIIRPGETVIIELDVNFALGNDLAGILFPRNSLSKNGIIMTNPGHIDPGYNGIISIYLVNMSTESYSINRQSPIAKLLIFRTSSQTSGYKGGTVTSLEESQLDRMGRDFAGLESRIPEILNRKIAKCTAGLVALAGIMITIISIAIPISLQLGTEKLNNNEKLQNQINQQSKEIEYLKKTINSNKKLDIKKEEK